MADPTPEDVYRAAAEALYADVSHNGAEVEVMAGASAFRAAVDAVLAAERERIVRAVRNLTAGDPVTADEVEDVVRGERRG